MDQVQTAKVENVENVFQGSGVASVFDGSGVASVFESGGSRDSSMVDFANPSASLMSEKLEQPWVESNGMEDDHNAPTDSAVGSEASKKLQLSLDELIEQQQGSHRQQQQSDYNNFRGRRRGQGVRPPYHHPHPYHHHPAIPPPPPISYGPMFSCPMNGPLGRPNGIGSLSIGSGFHRGEGQFPISAELLSRQSLRTASTLRRARLLRSQPYELMAGGRQQIVAELLLQQQRTRKALFLAGVNPDVQLVAPVPPLARSIRPRRKVEDPVVLAEQSALNDSELIYPVMIESSDGTTQVESSDDALIIEFKGTQVLKVRKSRGEMILNSGGWRTLSTRLVLNKALKPLGIWVDEVTPASSNPMTDAEWRVVDGKSFLVKFTDGMVIGNIGVSGRTHLMARASVIAQNWKQVKSNITRKRV